MGQKTQGQLVLVLLAFLLPRRLLLLLFRCLYELIHAKHGVAVLQQGFANTAPHM